MHFTDWSVKARSVYDPQLGFAPYTLLAWTVHAVSNLSYCPQRHVCVVRHLPSQCISNVI